jgi:hypothetical protein
LCTVERIHTPDRTVKIKKGTTGTRNRKEIPERLVHNTITQQKGYSWKASALCKAGIEKRAKYKSTKTRSDRLLKNL